MEKHSFYVKNHVTFLIEKIKLDNFVSLLLKVSNLRL